MSATVHGGAEGGAESDSAEDLRYFRAIEDTFIRLRGAPLLLAPADFRLSQEWRAAGMPLDVVERALDDFFRQRAEREGAKPVSTLRMCRRAVEGAWQRMVELAGPQRRDAAPALDVAAALAALAAAVPATLPGGEALAARVAALAGDPERVEAALAGLDQALLELADAALSGTQKEALDAELEQTLRTLASRLPAEEVEKARERLRRARLREIAELPLLSLFALPPS